ncbi:MAG: thiamine pyrophosphate-binding protein [Candidatus Methanospirareceae archaeon]
MHLSYPKDIMEETIEDTLLPPKRYLVDSNYFDRKLVINAAEKLVQAKRPAMLLGSGVVAADAIMEALELAELLNIPVVTSPKAKSVFPEDHPLSLGVFGFSGSPAAEEYLLGNVDVLLVVGASLNQVTTFSWDPKLQPSECLIHINIDPSEIGKNYVADIGLIGDCRAVLNEISFRVLRDLQTHDLKEERPIGEVARFKERVGVFYEKEKMFSDSVPIKPQALMHELQECLPEGAIVFVDAGNHTCWAQHYLQVKKPSITFALGLAAMGYATPAAIGGMLAA